MSACEQPLCVLGPSVWTVSSVNAKQLEQPAVQADPNRCKSDHGYPEFGRRGRTGSFEAFASRKIRFYDSAQSVLSDSYIEFRLAFNEALREQRPCDKWRLNFE